MRYLLIEIDSAATADRLRAQIDNSGEAKGMRVLGMYRKPSQLCGCPPEPYDPYQPNRVSVQGAKFGWWLCPSCRRPRPGSAQTLRNMLDVEGTPAKHLELMLSVRWVLDKAGKVRTALSPKTWR
jgi:hypothetical protein